jgi:hypothetical protein
MCVWALLAVLTASLATCLWSGDATAANRTFEHGVGTSAAVCVETPPLGESITVAASCFREDGDGNLTAIGPIDVNGLRIVSSRAGGSFTLDRKTHRLSASGEVEVFAGPLLLYKGGLAWNLTEKQMYLLAVKGLAIEGLPVGGELTLSLVPSGVRITAEATLGRVPYELSGMISLEVKTSTGLELSSLKVVLTEDLPIKSLLLLQEGTLAYNAASNEWSGTVKGQLTESGPAIVGHLSVHNGSISELALRIEQINESVDGIYLQSLGLEVAFAPNLFATGSVGLTVGPEILERAAVEMEGKVKAEFGQPFVLTATGTLSIVRYKIGDATLRIDIPGGVSFEGRLEVPLGVLVFDGGIEGAASSRGFDARGEVQVDTPFGRVSGHLLLDEEGVAGCVTIKVLFGSVIIGASDRWRGKSGLFDDTCGFGRLRSTLGVSGSAASRGSAANIVVPAQTGQINVVVRGADDASKLNLAGQFEPVGDELTENKPGAPYVELAEGKCHLRVAPDSSGRFCQALYAAIGNPEHHETDIAIRDPRAGTIAAAATPGQPELSEVFSSRLLSSPRPTAKLDPLGARCFRLTWSAGNVGWQRVLTFKDRQGLLYTTRRSTGTHDICPPGGGHIRPQGLQTIVKQDGLVREVISAQASRGALTGIQARRSASSHPE